MRDVTRGVRRLRPGTAALDPAVDVALTAACDGHLAGLDVTVDGAAGGAMSTESDPTKLCAPTCVVCLLTPS